MVLTRIGSSPVVGSSKKTISGSVTRARAIATRLRMPPEISAGFLCPMSTSPTWRSFSSTRWAIAPADRLEGGAPELGDVDAVHEHGARVRPQEPEQVLEQHRLAAAAPADDDHDLARRDVEIHPLQHGLAAEGLSQALDADHGSTEPRK